MSHVIDMTGAKCGLLTILQRDTSKPPGQAWWVCLCDCGNYHSVTGNYLRRGETKSCGCMRETVNIKKATAAQTKHGLRNSPEYYAWRALKKRCALSSTGCFHRYGGRGIVVCDEWRNSFEAFFRDMGERPTPNHSIDRIDNEKGYEPTNCRWATRRQQGNNKSTNVRLKHGGQEKTIIEWARFLGVPAPRLYKRREAGWSDSEIITGVRE